MQYEIRAMRVGELLDTGFRLLKQRFWLLMGLEACVLLPAVCLGLGVGAMEPLELNTSEGPEFAENALFSIAIVVLLGIAFLFGLLILQLIVAGAVTWVLAAIYRGETVGFAAALRAGLRVAPRLIGTWLLVLIVFGVGGAIVAAAAGGGGAVLSLLAGNGAAVQVLFTIMGIIGAGFLAVYFGLPLALLFPLAVLEGIFFRSALSRCFALLEGHRLRALGVYAAPVLLSYACQAPMVFLQAIPWLYIAAAISQAVVQAVVAIYFSVLAVLLYFDLRCRKEGYDLEQLTAAVAGRGLAG